MTNTRSPSVIDQFKSIHLKPVKIHVAEAWQPWKRGRRCCEAICGTHNASQDRRIASECRLGVVSVHTHTHELWNLSAPDHRVRVPSRVLVHSPQHHQSIQRFQHDNASREVREFSALLIYFSYWTNFTVFFTLYCNSHIFKPLKICNVTWLQCTSWVNAKMYNEKRESHSLLSHL